MDTKSQNKRALMLIGKALEIDPDFTFSEHDEIGDILARAEELLIIKDLRKLPNGTKLIWQPEGDWVQPARKDITTMEGKARITHLDGREFLFGGAQPESYRFPTNKELIEFNWEIPLFDRQCSCCKKGMNAGYCINGGDKYYCSDGCLSGSHSEQEIKEMGIGEEDSDSYWTEWTGGDE